MIRMFFDFFLHPFLSHTMQSKIYSTQIYTCHIIRYRYQNPQNIVE